MSKLQTKFHGLYHNGDNIRSNFPVINPLIMPLGILYELRTFSKDKQSKIRDEEFDIYKLSSHKEIRNIFLQGQPGFGKSTLCYLLAYYWSQSKKPASNFKLCILNNGPFPVQYGDDDDITQLIVEFCRTLLADPTYSLEDVQKTLTDYSDEILILLDEYDALSEPRQRRLKELLCTSPVFKKSTIIVTARQAKDENFLSLFQKQVYINGLSKPHLCKMIAATNIPQRDFWRSLYDSTMHPLFVLPPLFGPIFCLVVRDSKVSEFSSVYSLLSGMVERLVKIQFGKGSDFCENMFFQLGELLYKALARGTRTFTDDLLCGLFGNALNYLKRLNIIHPERGSFEEKRLWAISSKLLMVFFITKYLKHIWSTLNTDESKLEFLQTKMCHNVGTGDYVKSTGEAPCLYYVGLLPEIVLKLGKGTSLAVATIEMCYDVPEIEISSAFDSVNLLLRVQDKALHRFGFRRLSDDADATSVFDNVIQHFEISSCTLETKYYYNKYEQKNFLRLMATDNNDQAENILYAVLRANEMMDRIYIDFPFSMLEDVFTFVSQILTSHLKNFNLPEGSKYDSYGEFVFKLVCAFLECRIQFAIVVTCAFEGGGDLERRRHSVTFKISPDRKTQGNVVQLQFQFCFPRETFCTKFVWKKADFWHKKQLVLDNIISRKEGMQSETISVYLTNGTA